MRLYNYYGVCYGSNPQKTAIVIDVMFFPDPSQKRGPHLSLQAHLFVAPRLLRTSKRPYSRRRSLMARATLRQAVR